MRVVSFLLNGETRWGLLHDTAVLPCPATGEWPRSVLELIELGPDATRDCLASLARSQGARIALGDIQLLAPIPRPRKNIICLGLNYLAHAQESLAAKGQAFAPLADPVVFTKNVTSVNGPYSEVVLDPAVTEQLDWEAELAFVIGRSGRHIQEADALSHVFGYMTLNDLSARDLQFRHKQFFLGKSVDGCCPMGPALVTTDEIPDPQALDVRCWVNGELKQHGHTSQMMFGVARTIAILSRAMTLEPGDIVSTGTPEGVGFARKPPEFLRVGDLVECEVSGVGRIGNRIVGPRA